MIWFFKRDPIFLWGEVRPKRDQELVLSILAASADKKCGFYDQNMATKWTFTGRILPILAPIESWGSGLSIGAKLAKNEAV